MEWNGMGAVVVGQMYSPAARSSSRGEDISERWACNRRLPDSRLQRAPIIHSFPVHGHASLLSRCQGTWQQSSLLIPCIPLLGQSSKKVNQEGNAALLDPCCYACITTLTEGGSLNMNNQSSQAMALYRSSATWPQLTAYRRVDLYTMHSQLPTEGLCLSMEQCSIYRGF